MQSSCLMNLLTAECCIFHFKKTNVIFFYNIPCHLPFLHQLTQSVTMCLVDCTCVR